MEMVPDPIGLLTPQIGAALLERAGTEGQMTSAMRGLADKTFAYRRPIQGNTMFAAFGRSRW
jgi:hypothetical protein